MGTMSIDYAKKLKEIRSAEKLTQPQVSELTGLSLSFIKQYETGFKPARAEAMEAFLTVKQFKKYTMWLLHDEVLPLAGQINPALSLDGSDHSEVDQVSTETTPKSHR